MGFFGQTPCLVVTICYYFFVFVMLYIMVCMIPIKDVLYDERQSLQSCVLVRWSGGTVNESFLFRPTCITCSFRPTACWTAAWLKSSRSSSSSTTAGRCGRSGRDRALNRPIRTQRGNWKSWALVGHVQMFGCTTQAGPENGLLVDPPCWSTISKAFTFVLLL